MCHALTLTTHACEPCIYSFKTRPDRPTRNPIDPGLEPDRVYKKIKEVRNPVDPTIWLILSKTQF